MEITIVSVVINGIAFVIGKLLRWETLIFITITLGIIIFICMYLSWTRKEKKEAKNDSMR